MAYQQAGGMLNNAATAAANNEHHGSQGAEYTLQGRLPAMTGMRALADADKV